MEVKTNFLQYRETMRQNIPLPPGGPSPFWAQRIRVTMGMLQRNPIKVCIYKVPNELRKVNGDAYDPRIVSIGPLHEGEHDLLAMVEHKWRYMDSLLRRTQDPNKILDDCCSEVISNLEERARASYAENIKFDKYELAEIMLVDGCFMLELFLRSRDPELWIESDLIFRNAWMVSTLQHDLVLLENQIPFFVLDHLFTIFRPHIPTFQSCKIIDIALSFFQAKTSQDAPAIENGSQDVWHLLHLMHTFYQPSYPPNLPRDKKTRGFRDSATKLLEAGVEFEESRKGQLLEISFGNGVLKIPPLRIQETTESLVRNLIAFEQCGSLDTTHHITSYAILMKSLIRSPFDVQLLQKRGIITTNLGGVEDALTLFNNALKQVVLKDFYFGKLCDDVNAYQNSWWHRYRHRAFWRVRSQRFIGAWKKDEFFSPWRIISYVLLILTGLQTFYAVLAYYPH